MLMRAAQDSIERIRESLFVVEVWTTDDDSWQTNVRRPRPIVVYQTPELRLEQIWPCRPGRPHYQREACHVLTILGLVPDAYLHVLVARRPTTQNMWTILEVERMHTKFMGGAVR